MSEVLPAFLESELREVLELTKPGGPNHDRIVSITADLNRRYGQQAIVEALARIVKREASQPSEPTVLAFPHTGRPA